MDSPWQRRVYSGRFLRAVCTTSKSRLPRQYMNVGKKSAAMLEKPHVQWVPLPMPKPGRALPPRRGSRLGAHLGLCCMERRARLKARLRQDSSAESISRCRLVLGRGRQGVTQALRPLASWQLAGTQERTRRNPARPHHRTALGPQGPLGSMEHQPEQRAGTAWAPCSTGNTGQVPMHAAPAPKASQPRVPGGFHVPVPEMLPAAPPLGPPLPHREEAQDLRSPSGHLVYVTQNLQQI